MVSSFLFFSCYWNVTYVSFLFFYRLRLEWPAWVLGFRMVSIRFLHSFALRSLLTCSLLLFFRDAWISTWNEKSKLKWLFFFCYGVLLTFFLFVRLFSFFSCFFS